MALDEKRQKENTEIATKNNNEEIKTEVHTHTHIHMHTIFLVQQKKGTWPPSRILHHLYNLYAQIHTERPLLLQGTRKRTHLQ